MLDYNELQTREACEMISGNWDVFFMQERNRKGGSVGSSSFLPARFDWSIMGCTILLLAFINLEENRGGGKREKENLNHVYVDSSQANTKTKQFCAI